MSETDEEEYSICFEDCIYTSHYCEENVWKLCEQLKNDKYPLNYCYSVFISNDIKFTPLWHQKAGQGDRGEYFVAWDYHVIFIIKTEKECKVYDFDSLLGFPVEFDVYFDKGIRSDDLLPKPCYRFFRVVPAEQYLSIFASDRSHMKNEQGEWLYPPPFYEPIKTPQATHNLANFISMRRQEGPGIVMDSKNFKQFFTPSLPENNCE